MPHFADQVKFQSRPDGLELTVKVVPGASRTKVAGVWDTALKVAVSAPPEGGKANAAVVKLLAQVFGVKKGNVTLIAGTTQPVKRFAITDITPQDARQRLATR